MKYKEHNQLRYPIMTKQILALSDKNTVKRRQNILFMFMRYTIGYFLYIYSDHCYLPNAKQAN